MYINKIILNTVITAIITYFVNDYLSLKDKQLLEGQNDLLDLKYSKLDSLYLLEKQARINKDEYVAFVFDSLKNINQINTHLTGEAITEIESNKFENSQHEKDSVYNVLSQYRIDSTSNKIIFTDSIKS
jgi:hypothetical protein